MVDVTTPITDHEELHEAQIAAWKPQMSKPPCYDRMWCTTSSTWNVALTDREIKALYNGALACQVRPSAFQRDSKCRAPWLDAAWAETVMTPEERAKEIARYWLGLRKCELPMAEVDIARHIRIAIWQAGGRCHV